ncbi:MAG: formate acetyltransferase, partial [Clostridia bacterium]|nr:formate acetyltransferase [Clostridia bacterium]
MQYKGWEGFIPGKWNNNEVDVRDFIQRNYTPYEGEGNFLAPATEDTKILWGKVLKLTEEEKNAGGVLKADTYVISTLTSHGAGYIDKEREKIVGLQTDEPFKRALHPFGGIKMAEQALNAYDYELDSDVKDVFSKYRKTHNDGVYDAYTLEMRRARRAHILTGLPDTYGRGRIIGDYRRVALYGIDYLIEQKENDKEIIDGEMIPERVRDREEISDQIKALKALKKMASFYGIDISKPAENAQQAIQALYFGYLGAIKDQNGAAMSIGRNSTFLDIYIERDLKNGVLTEE